jgi:RNA polymerase sigma factor (sigma-70 family)
LLRDCREIVEEFVSGIPDVLRSPALAQDYSDLTGEELLCVCADLRDAAAWEEFVRRFHAALYTAVMRTGRRYERFHRGLCDDLVQETYLRLSANQARALREFVPRHPGSACTYLQVIAIRVTLDGCKKRDFRRIQDLPPHPSDVAAPDKTKWLALKAEVGDLLRKQATARDCQIFGLHYLQGMTAREIGGLAGIGLTVKGVESALVRLKHLIQKNFDYEKRE